MTKRMLVDATHPEEIRVAIIQDNRLIDLDIETSSREQIKGNIYLGKVSRVEPSLQAAFIDFGGGRQGFLSVNDIHPKYYPNAMPSEIRGEYLPIPLPEPVDGEEEDFEEEDEETKPASEAKRTKATAPADPDPEMRDQPATDAEEQTEADPDAGVEIDDDGTPVIDTFKRFPRRQRLPIQKILTRGQKLLVQVVKEPRGNKGASLTTNLSLAGRYAVLLPENEGGGGISRKIIDSEERKKLKEILETIAIPGQVSLIIRTAGLGRTKREIIRDLNYLLRLWKKILDNASQTESPGLLHEEGDLIMRTIRDLYATDMNEILIDGQEGYRRGKDFMRLLMPRYMKVVQPYKEPQPIFSRFQIENQIESMHDRIIQLKAGGYIVIEPTESMVTIDINSGRSTREKDVETTAFKTNLQAAEEIARQLRLRDLGGLIVIDFIDMEDKKHNLEIERELREALKLDRAKIQVGKISQFGLLELSRQRMKPAFAETNRQVCPRCKGLGTIRSVESAAIHLFRLLEEDIAKNRYARIVYRTSLEMANYLLNNKRAQLTALEAEHNAVLWIQGDETLQTPEHRVERTERPRQPGVQEEKPRPNLKESAPPAPEDDDEVADDADLAEEDEDAPQDAQPPAEGSGDRKKRRRRRRRSRQNAASQNGDAPATLPADSDASPEPAAPDGVAMEAPGLFVLTPSDGDSPIEDASAEEGAATSDAARRRRRRRRRSTGKSQRPEEDAAPQTEVEPAPDPSPPEPEPESESPAPKPARRTRQRSRTKTVPDTPTPEQPAGEVDASPPWEE
ncbi:MAG: ribonuclease E/G [Magnetococcales bacterium]|nr:ribonuclease E/G [Magnetococcales bacterium]